MEIRWILLFLIPNMYFTFVYSGTFETTFKCIMRVSENSRVGFLDLWNLNTYFCGDNTSTTLYRHDWIDRFDPTCITEAQLILGEWAFYQKYTVNVPNSIEGILQSTPDFLSMYDRRVNQDINDKYLINDGKYEYLSSNPTKDKLYLGIYTDKTLSDWPKMVYSPAGSPFTAGQDPLTLASIQTASVATFCVSLIQSPECLQSFSNHVNHKTECPSVPLVTSTMSVINTTEGATVTLDCQYIATGEITSVKWNFIDMNNVITIINPTTNPSKYAGSTIDSASLSIYSFSYDDEGQYICLVDTVVGQGRGPFITGGLIPGRPTVTTPTTSYELVLGNAVTLNCSYQAKPAATSITWLKENALFTECGTSGRRSFGTLSRPSLVLNSTETCDEGHYKCCVDNDEGITCSGEITLATKPKITVSSQVIAVQGEITSIGCTIESFATMTNVKWAILTQSANITYPSYPGYSGSMISSPSLQVTSPAQSHTGDYICIATNIIGSTRSSPVQFLVYGVDVTIIQTSYTAVYGNDVILSCSVSGVPNVALVSWQFANQTDVDTSSAIKYEGSSVADPSLRINFVTFDDAATYICIGKNDYQITSSQQITLTVTGALPSVTTSQTFVTVNQSESIVLDCQVSGEPAIQSVYWMKNVQGAYVQFLNGESGGNAASPPLVISNLQMSHSGLYMCVASNAIGETTGTPVNLTVNQVEPMCPCACSYVERLEFWATQNKTNYTMEELRVILRPVLDKLEKDLKVDVSNLSATINQRVSAPDDRSSSMSLGFMGIAFLTIIFGGIILLDLTSVPKLIAQMKNK